MSDITAAITEAATEAAARFAAFFRTRLKGDVPPEPEAPTDE